MLSRMSSHELTEWMAFASLEPFGGDTQYLGHAITASTIANVNRGKDKRAFEVDEFIPKFRKQKQQTADEMMQFAEMMTIGLGGKDMRNKDDD